MCGILKDDRCSREWATTLSLRVQKSDILDTGNKQQTALISVLSLGVAAQNNLLTVDSDNTVEPLARVSEAHAIIASHDRCGIGQVKGANEVGHANWIALKNLSGSLISRFYEMQPRASGVLLSRNSADRDTLHKAGEARVEKVGVNAAVVLQDCTTQEARHLSLKESVTDASIIVGELENLHSVAKGLQEVLGKSTAVDVVYELLFGERFMCFFGIRYRRGEWRRPGRCSHAVLVGVFTFEHKA
mmetsp:Transcript_6313/g.12810  ORF Transcript_6313/g.12810 Transcript_6313/m.12810 type:complete len:245 (-) Transcript_6313:3752-4486(-)